MVIGRENKMRMFPVVEDSERIAAKLFKKHATRGGGIQRAEPPRDRVKQ